MVEFVHMTDVMLNWLPGGTNPALRTFYYRLIRLMSLSIHPLFVFDGPNKPPFKRNKRTGHNIASIPEFLAKQLLKQFGFPYHIAPGEAEAECALLQREGIVDAVLSEDVDTLMFGSRLTIRNWSAEVSKTHSPTHVNVYEARKTKSESGLDREGMILVALMSGGDYIPEGIPGAGPKVACEAARAGFGHDLCKIAKGDATGFRGWRERLQDELRTNKSKFFKRKHGKLDIPDDFPNLEALGYYTQPAVSSKAQLDKLRDKLKWDQDIEFSELRKFTAEAFDWTKLGGAKKFVRNLAPVVLVKNLRLRGQKLDAKDQNVQNIEEESGLIKAFHGKRNHAITDGITEIRISYRPLDIVPIDLSLEEPDDEVPENDSEDDGIQFLDDDGVPTDASASPSKKRAAPNYDPSEIERLWIAESIIKAGMPLKVQEWESSLRDAKQYLEMKRAAQATAKEKSPRKKKAPNGGMPKGSLDRYARVMKPGTSSFSLSLKSNPSEKQANDQRQPNSLPPPPQPVFRRPQAASSFSTFQTAKDSEVITLLSSSPPTEISLKDALPPFHPGPDAIRDPFPNTVTKRRRSPLRRAKTDSAALGRICDEDRPNTPSRPRTNWTVLDSSPIASPSDLWPLKRSKPDVVDVLDLTGRSPSKRTPRRSYSTHFSPARQTEITTYFSPSKVRHKDMIGDRVEVEGHGRLNLATLITGTNLKSTGNKQGQKRPPKPSGQRERDRELQERSNNVTKLLPQPTFNLPSTLARRNIAITEKDSITEDSQNKRPDSPSLCRSPRINQNHPDRAKRKEVIRIRESLSGTFAIEEVDLTETTTTRVLMKNKDGKTFRVSDISVVDLSNVP